MIYLAYKTASAVRERPTQWSSPFTSAARSLVQRCAGVACPPEARGHTEEVQLRGLSTGHMQEPAPPIIYEVLRSPGQPLGTTTRAYMETRFGHDFSRVRVHADNKAAESATAVNAQAYTLGHHIVMGDGRYRPETFPGRGLLAHELAHVIQQPPNGGSFAAGRLEISPANDPSEQEARSAESAVMEGPPAYAAFRPLLARQGLASVSMKHNVAVQREPAGPSTVAGDWSALPSDARRAVRKDIFEGFSPLQQVEFRRVYAALKRAGYWDAVRDVTYVNVEFHQIDAAVEADLEERLVKDEHFCADRGLTNVFHRGMLSFRQVVRPGAEALHISVKSGFATLHLDTVSPVVGRGESGACAIGAGVGLEHLFRDVWHVDFPPRP